MIRLYQELIKPSISGYGPLRALRAQLSSLHIGDPLPISQPPNALVEDQVSASGIITFLLVEYCFPLAETQISASGTVLSASGQLAICQWRGRNCVRTVLKNVHFSASTENNSSLTLYITFLNTMLVLLPFVRMNMAIDGSTALY